MKIDMCIIAAILRALKTLGALHLGPDLNESMNGTRQLFWAYANVLGHRLLLGLAIIKISCWPLLRML